MTALQKAQRESRLATLAKLRVIVEGGELRLQPIVYCERDLRPAKRLTWDRMGKR